MKEIWLEYPFLNILSALYSAMVPGALPSVCARCGAQSTHLAGDLARSQAPKVYDVCVYVDLSSRSEAVG